MNNIVLTLLVAGVLCGCASDSKRTKRTFVFSLPSDPPATHAQTNTLTLNHVSIAPPFQSRSFTYRTGENSYEQDPYAGFLVLPERTLAESIRASMRASGVFGRVLEPGSALTPNLTAEISITALYGDFRNVSRPLGTLELHFICFEIRDDVPKRILLDRACARETPLTKRTPDALMAAWDTDLREIMKEINSEYSKVNPHL